MTAVFTIRHSGWKERVESELTRFYFSYIIFYTKDKVGLIKQIILQLFIGPHFKADMWFYKFEYGFDIRLHPFQV